MVTRARKGIEYYKYDDESDGGKYATYVYIMRILCAHKTERETFLYIIL